MPRFWGLAYLTKIHNVAEVGRQVTKCLFPTNSLQSPEQRHWLSGELRGRTIELSLPLEGFQISPYMRGTLRWGRGGVAAQGTPEPSSGAESTRGQRLPQGPQTPAGNSGRGPDCVDTPGPRGAPGGQPLGDPRGCFKPATECLRVSQPTGRRDPFIRARLITVAWEPQLWRGSDLP